MSLNTSFKYTVALLASACLPAGMRGLEAEPGNQAAAPPAGAHALDLTGGQEQLSLLSAADYAELRLTCGYLVRGYERLKTECEVYQLSRDHLVLESETRVQNMRQAAEGCEHNATLAELQMKRWEAQIEQNKANLKELDARLERFGENCSELNRSLETLLATLDTEKNRHKTNVETRKELERKLAKFKKNKLGPLEEELAQLDEECAAWRELIEPNDQTAKGEGGRAFGCNSIKEDLHNGRDWAKSKLKL